MVGIFYSLLFIVVGASVGALLRYGLSALLNPLFPTFPLGTLSANILGCLLIGIFIGIVKNHTYLSEQLRLGIVTGFLGGLTTFSTFSAEVFTLLSSREFFWASLVILGHVFGSLIATFLGFFTVKLWS